jgi:hypothetical protein
VVFQENFELRVNRAESSVLEERRPGPSKVTFSFDSGQKATL